MAETEAQLVSRARTGQLDAFEALVERYHRRVLSFARTVLADSEDAQDVAQDTFVKAFRALPRLRGQEAFGPWLLRICYRLALNRARANQVRRHYCDPGQNDTAIDLEVDPAPLPSDAMLDAELRRAAIAGIRSLPPAYAAVVWLRFAEEMKVRDIASALGLTRAAAESRLRRGAEMLRQRLLPFFPEFRDDGVVHEMHRDSATNLQTARR